jgi:hypothetical protein
MVKIPLSQVMHMAGVYWSDSDFERELKFLDWIADRKYRICSQSAPVPDDDIDVLIIEE